MSNQPKQTRPPKHRTKKSDSATAISSFVVLPSLTTTQRDALPAVSGDLIYNTTTNKFQGRTTTVWVDLH